MTPLRILVVRLGAMGDILHTLPAVATLKQSFPHSHVAWAIEPSWTELLRDNPFVDETVLVDRHSFRSVLELRRRLRQTRWDFAVDFQGLIKSAVVASFARPERLFGFHRSQVREKLSALFYSTSIRAHSAHVVDRYLELAQGAGASNVVRAFALPRGKGEGTLPDGEFVLANPLAGWTSKQWPIENYVELGRRLERMGLPLILNVSAPIDVPELRQHVSGLPGLIDATRRAAAVVGVDSGPLHLAAALGKPGIAIFGPTDPARNGPYGNGIHVIRRADAVTTYKRGPTIDPSMRAVTVDEVMIALKERLPCPAK